MINHFAANVMQNEALCANDEENTAKRTKKAIKKIASTSNEG